MSNIIKLFDEEYIEYIRVKTIIYSAYQRDAQDLTGEILDAYDKFMELYPVMKRRYNAKITSKGFMAWLNSIDEFEP